MLTLIDTTHQQQTVKHFILKQAPVFALLTMATLQGDMALSELRAFSHQCLSQWCQMNITDKSPNDDYESAFWLLLQQMMTIEDYQLLGNTFMQYKTASYANYLLNLSPCPALPLIQRP